DPPGVIFLPYTTLFRSGVAIGAHIGQRNAAVTGGCSCTPAQTSGFDGTEGSLQRGDAFNLAEIDHAVGIFDLHTATDLFKRHFAETVADIDISTRWPASDTAVVGGALYVARDVRKSDGAETAVKVRRAIHGIC